MERRRLELQLVAARWGELEHAADLSWFIVPRWTLPPGWSRTETPVLVFVPPGYPVTPPDCFFAAPDLRLANGAQPGNSGLQHQLGREWLWFSYHVDQSTWHPSADPASGHSLLTFLAGIDRRFGEAS